LGGVGRRGKRKRSQVRGAYAGGVGAVALVAEGAFADDVAVGVAGEWRGVLVAGCQGGERRGGGGKDEAWGVGAYGVSSALMLPAPVVEEH